MTILCILESPGKISKISQILGKNYICKASKGHFRNLHEKNMSIDFDNNFEPIYVITKPDVVKNLKSSMNNIDMVYIASDMDMEGEQIAQSVYDVLRPKKYKRLRFNAITKDAIMDSIKNAGKIDKNLVGAQKARRVLDRIYGYQISDILRNQIGKGVTGGRVQSIAAKIVIDKENEIKNFMDKNSDSSYFKVNGCFSKMKATLYESIDKKAYNIKTEYKGKIAHLLLADSDTPNSQVIAFMKKCLKSEFLVHVIFDKISSRSPSPPFTTSTLQQEANRKFGMLVDTTMKIAQKLYEGGYITYMRTDSVEISKEGHEEIKKVIEKEYGKEYYQKNVYKNKAVNAQNAHEAIRPTHPDVLSLENEMDDNQQIKLYKLIWQRTIASQMKPAQIKITNIQISISKYLEEKSDLFYYFLSQIENIIFPGFMKVYIESVDDTNDTDNEITKNIGVNVNLAMDEKLIMEQVIAKQEYLKPPPRYSQASLVKKMEELGIGRPSTTVTIIKTIMDREYVETKNVPGIKKDITTYTIKSKNKKHIMEIFEDDGTILLGKEANKLVPTNLGVTVNDFLIENFLEMMDYKFTAKMEEELDSIADGNKIWYKVVQKYYDKLHPIVEKLSQKKSIIKSSEKLLGEDDGNEIIATKTKFGPVARKKIGTEVFYAEIEKPLTLENIRLQDAIKLFEYPKILGQHEGTNVLLKKGKFGIYISYDNTNYAIGENTSDISKINLKKAIKIIQTKNLNNLAEFNIAEKKIRAIVINGKFGPYVQIIKGKTKSNYPIPKNLDPKKLTKENILEIISNKNKLYTGSKKNNNSKNNTKSNSRNK